MIPLPEVHFGADGLVPVVIQDHHTGAVLTVAYANAEALARTAATGQTWLWSRSRKELWHKGATSGHTQVVQAIVADCDQDAVLYQVRPNGPACHLGTVSCFVDGAPVLARLDGRLADRAASRPPGSYTTTLLDDSNKRMKKLGEEAIELAMACAQGTDDDVANEAADLVFHVLVALRGRGLGLAELARVLGTRLGEP